METTYAHDLPDLAACQQALPALLEEFLRRFARHRDNDARPVHQAVVKIKFADFAQTTIQCRASAPPELPVWQGLLARAHARHGGAVRLLGLGVQFAEVDAHTAFARQPSLF